MRLPDTRKEVRPKKTMSTTTELSASEEKTTTIGLKDTTLNKKDMIRMFDDVFGIHSYELSKSTIFISYNPSVITPDSIRKILSDNQIHILD